MKTTVLWICNLIFPEVAKEIGEVKSSAGGWMLGAAEALRKSPKIELYILSFSTKINKVQYITIQDRKYIVAPCQQYDVSYRKIKNDIGPDVIHVYGTEIAHSWKVLEVFSADRVVFSLQGIISEYYRYYYADIPEKVIRSRGLYEYITGDSLQKQRKKFHDRGVEEVALLRKAKHVIGRTEWDFAVSKAINPQIKYHFCNETLRSDFYDLEEKWDQSKCNEHEIFISQGSYPIKGSHFAIQAMPIILKKYPDAKLVIAGTNILKNNNKKNYWKMSSYAKYISKLIQKYKLQNSVDFIGNLDAFQMKKQYLEANVFLCPSAIENSPNSLGEAMILGTPCVATCVGGIQTMLIHNSEGLIYQYNSSAMLAHSIERLFDDKQLQLEFSSNAKKHAIKTHDPEKNAKDLCEIYGSIIGDQTT